MNTKQTIFVNEYLKCWNASEAARRAGYNGRSNQIGSRLLTDVDIANEIKHRIEESKMSADEVLLRLANQARSNMADFAHINTADDLKSLGETACVIKKFKKRVFDTPIGERQDIEIELYDAQSALALIGKNHGLFTDKIDIKIEKEMDSVLTTLEQSLDADTFQRVLQALSARRDNPEISGATFTEDTE